MPGDWSHGEQGVRERLAWALRSWCERQDIAVSSAHVRLADGWVGEKPISSSTVKDIAGHRNVANRWEAKHTGQTGMLWAMCERMGVSAEWILSARGAMWRGEATAGPDFLAELASLVLEAMPRRTGDVASPAIDGEACLAACIAAARAQWDGFHRRAEWKRLTRQLELLARESLEARARGAGTREAREDAEATWRQLARLSAFAPHDEPRETPAIVVDALSSRATRDSPIAFGVRLPRHGVVSRGRKAAGPVSPGEALASGDPEPYVRQLPPAERAERRWQLWCFIAAESLAPRDIDAAIAAARAVGPEAMRETSEHFAELRARTCPSD